MLIKKLIEQKVKRMLIKKLINKKNRSWYQCYMQIIHIIKKHTLEHYQKTLFLAHLFDVLIYFFPAGLSNLK